VITNYLYTKNRRIQIMKSFKNLLIAALFAVTMVSGGVAHATLSGIDFNPVVANTGTKASFGSDINVVGWSFTVDQTFNIKYLSYLDYATHRDGYLMKESHQVAVYNAGTGEMVVSATVNPNDTVVRGDNTYARWRLASIPETNLAVGNYVIAANIGNDPYTFDPANFTTYGKITFGSDVFDSGSASLPPTWTSTESAGVTGGFGPNFVPAPIPAAAWLLGSGLLSLVGIRRRNK
jgi:hypothetical protein